MKRDLISLEDFSSEEIFQLLDMAQELKEKKGQRLDILKGKSIGLIFQKPSNRTRVSFEVGIWELGGNCIYLGPHEINLGARETTADVARTLSRYLYGIVARTFFHKDIMELGYYATIPIINGLSDLFHPCQALADIFTIKEKFGKFKGLKLAYIGDGNNVCHSLLFACAKTGLSITVATPKKYEPDTNIIAAAEGIAQKTEAQLIFTPDPLEAAQGAHIIYADVWTSMGQEKERSSRLKSFKPYQINKRITEQAHEDYVFMHCLPAHRGEEVTPDIIDGVHSIIFDQAENRMHVQKAVLSFLCGKE